jgi:hypothetical protein
MIDDFGTMTQTGTRWREGFWRACIEYVLLGGRGRMLMVIGAASEFPMTRIMCSSVSFSSESRVNMVLVAPVLISIVELKYSKQDRESLEIFIR